jgi:hypothetical protein
LALAGAYAYSLQANAEGGASISIDGQIDYAGYPCTTTLKSVETNFDYVLEQEDFEATIFASVDDFADPAPGNC